ncbi:MAG: hypothetical protein JSV65_00435 [Armatimonadota bacterium]|nr:MAG: hypothetical protein JSV65_00435 [Armatimonadota bacterium]
MEIDDEQVGFALTLLKFHPWVSRPRAADAGDMSGSFHCDSDGRYDRMSRCTDRQYVDQSRQQAVFAERRAEQARLGLGASALIRGAQASDAAVPLPTNESNRPVHRAASGSDGDVGIELSRRAERAAIHHADGGATEQALQLRQVSRDQFLPAHAVENEDDGFAV